MEANTVQMVLVVVKFVVSAGTLCPLAVAAWRQSFAWRF